MKTTKMNLANLQGKLSRAEMKNIMAGYTAPPQCGLYRCFGTGCPDGCHCPIACTQCA